MSYDLPTITDAISPEVDRAEHFQAMWANLHRPNDLTSAPLWRPGDPVYARSGNYVRRLYDVLNDTDPQAMRFHNLTSAWLPHGGIVCHTCEVAWLVEDSALCFVCDQPGTSERRVA